MEIAGQLVLITGASSGIGAAIARLLASKGARVLMLARTQSALDRIAGDIRAGGGEAHTFQVDVANPTAVEQAGRSILQDIGVPDVIVNNAGAGRFLWLEDTSTEDLVQFTAVPYFGAFYVTKAFLPGMLRRRSGHVVNITSPAGFIGFPGSTAYTAARWAMRGFNEALRVDVRGTGIAVTLVVPAEVQSQYMQNNPGAAERLPPISKLYGKLSPEDVAEAIASAIAHRKRYAIIPFPLRITLFLHRLFPRLVEWLALTSAIRR